MVSTVMDSLTSRMDQDSVLQLYRAKFAINSVSERVNKALVMKFLPPWYKEYD